MSLSWSGWHLPPHYVQLTPQENVVMLANIRSSVVASGGETFSTFSVSLAIWCSLGQEAAVCLITGAVIGMSR